MTIETIHHGIKKERKKLRGFFHAIWDLLRQSVPLASTHFFFGLFRHRRFRVFPGNRGVSREMEVEIPPAFGGPGEAD